MTKWYVLFVKTTKEELIKRILELLLNTYQVKVKIPKKKIVEKKCGVKSDVIKKLFPGYILINVDMNPETYKKIIKIPYVYDILGTGEYYTSINREEIKLIVNLMGSNELIEYSTIYFEGTNVRVREGPLKGIEGLIRKINKRKQRAKISLTFLGKERLIDVGIEILEII